MTFLAVSQGQNLYPREDETFEITAKLKGTDGIQKRMKQIGERHSLYNHKTQTLTRKDIKKGQAAKELYSQTSISN